MSPVRRAVIDVGTNSIKLLVAEIDGRDVRPLWEDSKQTRLGSGFYKTQQLQPEAIVNTAKAVSDFAAQARAMNAESVRVIATSAARDAANAQDLISVVEQTSDLKMQIITGEQEAEWAFQGVTTDPKLAREHLLLLDVGGGSTEFILGQGENMHFRHSFPIGTVRLLEKFPHNNPPTAQQFAECHEWVRQFLDEKVKPHLEPAMERETQMRPRSAVQLVGTGGTATILARMEAQIDDYDRDRIESTPLSLPRVKAHLKQLWSLPLEERQQIIGVPPKRADVIITGVMIYEAVMEQFQFGKLRVTTRGLRYAAVMDGV